jgi:hypothetical protein
LIRENAMRIEQNPLFRKVIVPWYDSKIVCRIMIVFALFTLLFGLIGISVANATEIYNDYIWVPAVLTAASAVVLVAAAIRLVKQYT